jgi:hypothetical protein
MNNFWRQEGRLAYALAAAFLAGFFLRLYLLKDQVFSDDEWHGLYYVIGKSPGWLLTHFSIPGATCIPLNIYTWILGATAGWSEMLLRVPSLICGILCIVVCPLLARKIIGTRQAAWLALLLAISPILIFYSRFCRPYSAVAFLAFASILFAARWMQNGRLRNGIFFALTGVLAVYFHLFAIVTVATPVLMAFVRFARKGILPGEPPLKHWRLVAAGMAAAIAILVLPALIGSMRSTFFNIALAGTFKLESLSVAATLISGTAQPVLNLLFWICTAVGAVTLCRRNPPFGWMLVSLFPLHAMALIFSRPDSAQAAIVLVRYCIPLVPVSLLFAACGIEKILETAAARVKLQTGLQMAAAVAFIGALALCGPLPQCYVTPNNFTNHGAFQYRYAPIDWSESFSSDLKPTDSTLNTAIRVGEVCPFYGVLATNSDKRPIVEYPMFIGDHFNPLYYYQHFHRRPVIVGYTTDMVLASGLAPGHIFGNTYVDQVLSVVQKQSQINFRNMISMDDLAAMRARGAEFVILHKRFEARISEVAAPPPDLSRLYQNYREKLGTPAYEDANVAAFKL